MEAAMFDQIKPYMMHIIQPLRTCTMYLWSHNGHFWILVASNGLQIQSKVMFSCMKCLLLQCFIKENPTWCILFSLSEHVQCICELIIVICELWWPLMASNSSQNCCFYAWNAFILQLYFSLGLVKPWGPSKGNLLGWFIRGKVVLQWRLQCLIK